MSMPLRRSRCEPPSSYLERAYVIPDSIFLPVQLVLMPSAKDTLSCTPIDVLMEISHYAEM